MLMDKEFAALCDVVEHGEKLVAALARARAAQKRRLGEAGDIDEAIDLEETLLAGYRAARDARQKTLRALAIPDVRVAA